PECLPVWRSPPATSRQGVLCPSILSSPCGRSDFAGTPRLSRDPLKSRHSHDVKEDPMPSCVAGLLSVVVALGFGQARKTDDALEKLRNEFVLAFNAKDAARVASFYTEDAIAMPPNEPMITGRSNIEASFKTAFDRNIGSIALQSIESA